MYRDRMPACPTCRAELVSAGSVRGCSTCRGVWVSEQVLTEMVWDIHRGAETEPLAWQVRDGEARPCPACDKPMATVTLERVPVDRCREHGVWLDAGELAAALQHAASRPPRVDGIEVDLSPIELHRTAGTTHRAMDAEREVLLQWWFAAAVRQVEAKTVGVEKRILATAIDQLLAALRDKPATERPTCDVAVAFAGRVDAAVQFPPRSPQARYLIAAKPFADAWCVRYGVLAEHFGDLDVDAQALHDYHAALGPAIALAAEIVAPGDVLAAHQRSVELLQLQHECLEAAFHAAHTRDAAETSRQLERFFRRFVETEEAVSMLIARTT